MEFQKKAWFQAWAALLKSLRPLSPSPAAPMIASSRVAGDLPAFSSSSLTVLT